MKKFAERLKQARQDAGISQQSLVDATGIHLRQLGRYEQDVSEPTLPKLIAIADVLGVSIDYLAGRTDDPKLYK